MNKKKTVIGIVIAAALILVSVVGVQLIRYNNIKEYRELLHRADEEFDKDGFRAGFGGYIKNLEVKDSVGYVVGIYGMLFDKVDYTKLTEAEGFNYYDYMAYETNDYDLYYYSLEEVEPFYVGICITDDNGDILYRGVSEINNREPLGTIHMEEMKVYDSIIFYLLDEDAIKAYEEYSGDTVPKDKYPTKTNYRWDIMEIFGGKATQS